MTGWDGCVAWETGQCLGLGFGLCLFNRQVLKLRRGEIFVVGLAASKRSWVCCLIISCWMNATGWATSNPPPIANPQRQSYLPTCSQPYPNPLLPYPRCRPVGNLLTKPSSAVYVFHTVLRCTYACLPTSLKLQAASRSSTTAIQQHSTVDITCHGVWPYKLISTLITLSLRLTRHLQNSHFVLFSKRLTIWSPPSPYLLFFKLLQVFSTSSPSSINSTTLPRISYPSIHIPIQPTIRISS